MNGILIVDKPSGWTSFDVIAKLRGILATRGIGHSGTLDPMATGVLPVFVGMARKAVDMQQDHDKAYRAVVRFGVATDTGDITGQVLRTSEKAVSQQQLMEVIPRFLGRQLQTPPMYSAVKVNGMPLYKAARQGVEVERKARPVEIHTIRLMEQCGPQDFALEVFCGKGTYIRTLAEDMGAALGVPATLAQLRRIRAGVYGLENSHTLEQIQAARDAGTLEELLVPVDTVFAHLPRLDVNQDTCKRLYNGAPTYRFPAQEGQYRLYGPEGEFLGLGQVRDRVLNVQKLFVERA